MSEGVTPDSGTYIMYWEGKWEKAYWVELQDVDGYPAGWGDYDNWETIDKSFELGEAFFVSPNSLTTDPAITIAGQVYDAKGAAYGAIPLTKGNMDFVSPIYPGPGLALSDIKMSEGVNPDSGSYIMWWEGVWVKAYWVELQDVDGYPAGWGDYDNWETVTKDFAQSEGYFVSANSLTVEPAILFPNPLAEKK